MSTGDWQYKANPQLAVEDQKVTPVPDITTETIFTPETFRDRYLSPFGCGFSLEPRILQSAWFRPHNISEEAKGLFLVGAGTHPGAGLPGVVASSEVLETMIPNLSKQVKDVRMAAE